MGYNRPNTYSLRGGHINFTPIDSTIYYFGAFDNYAPGTTIATHKIYVPRSGRIRQAIYRTYAITTVGTNEDIVVAIRVNDTTDYTFSTLGSASAQRIFSNYALDIPVNAGDYISLKITTPAWVTNPDGVRGDITLIIECE